MPNLYCTLYCTVLYRNLSFRCTYITLHSYYYYIAITVLLLLLRLRFRQLPAPLIRDRYGPLCPFAIEIEIEIDMIQYAAAQELTNWDCIAGDGDCGTTFKRGAEALIADLEAGRLPQGDLRMLLRALSDRFAPRSGSGIGSNSCCV